MGIQGFGHGISHAFPAFAGEMGSLRKHTGVGCVTRWPWEATLSRATGVNPERSEVSQEQVVDQSLQDRAQLVQSTKAKSMSLFKDQSL